MERSEYKQIAEVLGGRKVFGRSKWSTLYGPCRSRRGSPSTRLSRLKEAFRAKRPRDLYRLDVSTKTASRWRHAEKSRLPVSVSDRIYRFARDSSPSPSMSWRTRTQPGIGCGRSRWGWVRTPQSN